jgi:hypothetical protein
MNSKIDGNNDYTDSAQNQSQKPQHKLFASKQSINVPVPAATAKNAFSLSACMSVSREKLEQLPIENKKDKLTVSFILVLFLFNTH